MYDGSIMETLLLQEDDILISINKRASGNIFIKMAT
jgi:hypothetical protein